MSQCEQCGTTNGPRHHCLERRVQVLVAGREQDSIQVLRADAVRTYCNQGCWSGDEASVMESLKLQSAWPPFALVGECCRCGKPVDRRQAHVSFAVLDEELEVKPWLTSATIHEDMEFAILCPDCDCPSFEAESGEEPSDQYQPLIAEVERPVGELEGEKWASRKTYCAT